MKTTSCLAVVGTLFCVCSVAAQDVIWGVKSHDPVSDPPSTLFSFEATGGAFNIIGVITLGGNAIDVDALAVNADQTLFGFEVSAVSQRSRLITIDRATATATARGPYLEGREIRGATITTAGRLLVIDTVANTVVEIGKQTGVPFGPEVELRYEGEAFNISSIADLVETDVGSLVLVWFNRFFALDAGTGQLELLHEDEVNGPDGVNVGAAGLAWLAVTPDGPRLAVYDVQWDDDIFGYDPANTFQRENLYLDIIPSYNAGRGDLASIPAIAIGIGDDATPPALSLVKARPNPFNPRTTITFDVAATSDVRLSIHDLAGRQVRILVQDNLTAGRHAVPWDGRDDRGRALPAGVYICRARTADAASAIRLTWSSDMSLLASRPRCCQLTGASLLCRKWFPGAPAAVSRPPAPILANCKLN